VSTAKLFMTGRSQAVRLPKEFRFEGKEVRISRVGNGVLLQPVKKVSLKKLFEESDFDFD
jgi:antitoxin VapB